MPLFSYLVVELEETELVWIVRVNQFSKLFEVPVIHAQKVIFDTQLINQICLSPMAFEKFGHFVVWRDIFEVLRYEDKFSHIFNLLRQLTSANLIAVEVLGSVWAELIEK